ncbi:polysaccharide biosynthesis tyrosine autokinase [Brevibacterium yomogidense]|uniref:polysaccharide biosynthesis tyrosine autokinase n=1 Tax=Brevibacterium yomogidense TaxID=946573 RepID=UPI0018E04757|nr:polysaccharide biosynthesis tyrosine autokinase [Brevibacterium yomogidense]
MVTAIPRSSSTRDANGDRMLELGDYLRMVRRSWVMVVSIVAAGILVAAASVLFTTPRYEATTELYVSVLGAERSTDDLVRGSDFARQSVESYVRIATSNSVLDPVVDELGLDMTGRELAQDVTAVAPEDTSLVVLTVTGEDPALTARIAAAVGESLKDVVETKLAGFTSGDGATPMSTVRLTTVQDAITSKSPVVPVPSLYLALGLLGGLVAGVGAAVLRGVLDTRLHTADDIAAVTDRPVIGEIAFDKNAQSDPLLLSSKGPSPQAESFRSLRTNLRFLSASGNGVATSRSLVVTSSRTFEGRTTTVVNLAIALAGAGARVLLIDGDLRRPRMAQYLGIDGNTGLSDVLIGHRDPWQVIQRWGGDGLHVLPSGAVPPNPSELLEMPGMRNLIGAMQTQFEFVLIDSPPVLVATDATVISRYTDGVLFVAASGETARRELENGLRAFETVGSRVRGVVLTKVRRHTTQAYGYGDYESEPDVPITSPARPRTRWVGTHSDNGAEPDETAPLTTDEGAFR